MVAVSVVALLFAYPCRNGCMPVIRTAVADSPSLKRAGRNPGDTAMQSPDSTGPGCGLLPSYFLLRWRGADFLHRRFNEGPRLSEVSREQTVSSGCVS